MCTILEKRNASENTKAQRLYNERLLELERLIGNLGQIDRTVSVREGELIESRKYVGLFKSKMGQAKEGTIFELNDSTKFQTSSRADITNPLKKKSYSTAKLFK